MRDTPRGIVEELREAAALEAAELGVPVRQLTASEAADYIEYLEAALRRIAAGELEPIALAAEALDLTLWLLSDAEVGDDG